MIYKVVALVGKSGSGKDTIKKILMQYNDSFHSIVRDTSRPIRDNEVCGVDYNFYEPIYFAMNEYVEEVVYNDWHYGTALGSLREDKINIGCFDQEATRQLMANPDIDLQIIYIDSTDKERLLRQLKRELDPNVKEIIRRYGTDEVDYSEEVMWGFESNSNGYDVVRNYHGFIYNVVDEVYLLIANLYELDK